MKSGKWSKRVGMVALMVMLGLVGACSDDDTAESDDNNQQTVEDASDTTDEDSSTVDADDDGGPGTSDVGPDTEPETGGTPDGGPADTGEDAPDPGDVGDAGDGDTGSAGDTGADATDTADAGPVDAGHSGCSYPPTDSTCPDGDYGPASFVSEFVIKRSGECCHDFDADNSDDSALGDLAANLETLLQVNFNDLIDAQIQNGLLVYLFEYAYWSDETDDPALEFSFLFGQDESPDFSDNLAGTGDFLVDPASLDSNGDPKSSFPQASVVGGRLSVANGTAPLVLPVGAELVEVVVENVRISADVTPGADLEAGGRVALTNGELSGTVSLDEMFGALNTVAEACSCISQSTHPVFVEEVNNGTPNWVCTSTDQDNSSCQNDSSATQMCQTLADNESAFGCSYVAQVIDSQADLDLDQDQHEDAYSLGAEFEAVGASIVGQAQ
jgi:hypothetical protein